MATNLKICTIINTVTQERCFMANIFENRTAHVFERWVEDIKKKNVNETIPVSLIVPAKLIVFAWTYASYQTHELKNRFGSINFVECLEDVFLNKIAQITLALYFGYNDDDILDGKTFVHLDPSAKDERIFIDMYLFQENKPIRVSGTKRFIYPTVEKNPTYGQLFVYIDASRLVSTQRALSRINIQNATLKSTIVGYATKGEIKTNQEQALLLKYSNKYSAFKGFETLKSINNLSYQEKRYGVPKYVEELKCHDNMECKMSEILTYIKNNTEMKPIVQIDYAKLFDGIINK